jgi:hypothetical protein
VKEGENTEYNTHPHNVNTQPEPVEQHFTLDSLASVSTASDWRIE